MLTDQQEKTRTTQEGKIFTLFDTRLEGFKFKASGKDEKSLGLKEDMEKNTPKEIQDAALRRQPATRSAFFEVLNSSSLVT